MSFRDQLETDRDAAFLAGREFGEQVVRIIGGDPDALEDVQAIVDWSEESETKTGERALTSDPKGRRVPAWCWLEVAADQDVNDNDKFTVSYCGGEVVVNFVRVVESDEAMKTLLCKSPGSRTTKRPRTRQ